MGASHTKPSEHLSDGSRWAAQVYVCGFSVLSPPPEAQAAPAPGLESVFIPALIDAGVSVLGAVLKAAAEEETMSYAGARAVPLFRAAAKDTAQTGAVKQLGAVLHPQFRYVLVVAGEFSATDAALGYAPVTQPEAPFDPASGSIGARLRAAGIPVIGDAPDLAFEGCIEPVGGGDAFIVRSTFLSVSKFQSKRLFDGDKRGLVINVSLLQSAAAEAGRTLRAMPLDFATVSKDVRLTPSSLGPGARSMLMSPLEGMALAEARLAVVNAIAADHAAMQAEIAARRQALATAKANNTGDVAALEQALAQAEVKLGRLELRYRAAAQACETLVHVDVVAEVVETARPLAVVQFLADVFEKAQPGLIEALKQRFDPAAVRARGQERVDAQRAAEDALSAARIDYLRKRDALSTAAAGAVHDIAYEEFLVAMRAYNRLLAQAGSATVTN